MVNRIFSTIALLLVIGCASKPTETQTTPTETKPVATAPQPDDVCPSPMQVILVNKMKNGELPVLLSTDHKTWKTVPIKSGEKKTFDAKAPKMTAGKTSSPPRFFIHTGTEQELKGGGFYAIEREGGKIVIKELPTSCGSGQKL